MNESIYHVRPFEPRDYAAEADTSTQLDPGRVFTVEELVRSDSLFIPPFGYYKIVAEERSTGRAVGFGYLHHDLESFDQQRFWIYAQVHPRCQGRGIGLALAADLSAQSTRWHARELWVAARADNARAVAFLLRQGFIERRRNWRAMLDLAGATTLPDRSEELNRQGLTFTTMADWPIGRPEVDRELYELSVATAADEPRPGPYTPIPFQQFVESELDPPSVLPDAFFLARAPDRFVALSVLHRAEGQPDILQQSFTGTVPEFRGRGIATELKRRTVEYGRRHGFKFIRTGNDSLNLPMLAINRKLGFRRETERLFAEKRLDTPVHPQ